MHAHMQVLVEAGEYVQEDVLSTLPTFIASDTLLQVCIRICIYIYIYIYVGVYPYMYVYIYIYIYICVCVCVYVYHVCK
jgi:hypothetical protein